MNILQSLFSSILGNVGGSTGGGGGLLSSIMSPITNLIGGPGSKSGTLFSLPNELLTGVADLGNSKNIIGDASGLGRRLIGGLLSNINPFRY